MCVPAAETCDGTDEDCDTRVDESFDLAADTSNCGACGRVCAFDHATSECRSGVCTATACEAGFGDCNGSSGDGCETATSMNRDDCGTCGTRCRGMTGTCCRGVCQSSCP
jgi:hypothetical protein